MVKISLSKVPSRYGKPIMRGDFTLSAIRILPACDDKLRKCLKDEWYYFNHRLELNPDGKTMHVVPENPVMKDFYGKNIHINAIVGVNGSGKSSLLELEYRIINNLSCILNRGKRRKAAESLYYVDKLHAELHYVIDGEWGCISCQGKTIKLVIPNHEMIVLEAFPTYEIPKGTEVLMKEFIDWARSGLFYTIVTNYSLQAFISNDFRGEEVFLLDRKHGPIAKEEASWINGLFHKNDGYMTPLVLNPYRDEGIIDMVKEHRLSLYRLSSCFVHAKNNGRTFIKDYQLRRLYYEFNLTFVQEKLKKNWDISENAIWNYKPNQELLPSYADVILNTYGYTINNLDWDNEFVRNAALYLVDKTLNVAKHYPGYEEFKSLDEALSMFQNTTSESEAFLTKLAKTIKGSKSHETIKIHQTIHFLDACRDLDLLKASDFDMHQMFDYDNYVKRIGGDPKSKKMMEIQEYLPPSFFSIHIELDHFDKNGKQDNDTGIMVERLSSGERQYLYTFSTYIYHILNILSIQSSSRVRYRNLNLVLDEVEICFHPEFQRRFVYELINYIERLKLNAYAAINIQIATHSPFILGDILEVNTLYLRDGHTAQKAEDFKNPFCSNICDLLYQSFFLESGFYGEYSKMKINQILHLLTGHKRISKTKMDYIQAMANTIGDDFLKMHLRQLMDKRGIAYEKTTD